MKVVIDTSNLISALGWQGYSHKIVHMAFERKYELCISLEMLEELNEVAPRKKFDFSPEEVDEFIEAVLQVANVVFPETKNTVITEDPDDNKILDCAEAANALFIVSGDKHLLKLKKFKKAEILTAREFWEKVCSKF